MQLRILDHKRFLEALRLPEAAGRVVVAVHEIEGEVSRFAVEIGEGRAVVTRAVAAPDFSCSDRIWATIACGDLPASRAVEMGVASAEQTRAAQILDVLGVGPPPFTSEYF
jgi:hypothetical protein